MNLLLSKFILPINSPPFENGAVVIHQDKIQEVGSAQLLLQKYPNAKPEDLGNSCLIPGLVNAHCHLELTEAPRYEPYDFQEPNGEPNFVRWLISISKYQDSLKPEKKRQAIRSGLKLLAQEGTTTVGDWTTYEGCLKLYDQSPLRVVVYPEVMNLNPELLQDRFESALALVDEVVGSNHPRIKAGLAPYAPYTLSKNLLKIFYQHLKQLQIPVQIHASSSFAEMEFFYDSQGEITHLLFPHAGWGENFPPPHQKTPIQYLSSIDFLKIRPALVGCVHLGPTDLSSIANSKSSIIHCPQTDETLKLGKTPLEKILAHKIPIGLGSEHFGCNSTFSLWDEMRKILELREKSESLITPPEILKMATLGGAYCLGLEKQIGSLEKGKLADLIAVKTASDANLENLTEKIILETTSEKILKQWVGGVEA